MQITPIKIERVQSPSRSDEEDVVITSTEILLSRIFVSKVIKKKHPSRHGVHIGHIESRLIPIFLESFLPTFTRG